MSCVRMAALAAPSMDEPEVDATVSSRALGTVIGHETLQGFDSQPHLRDALSPVGDGWSVEGVKRDNIQVGNHMAFGIRMGDTMRLDPKQRVVICQPVSG